MEPSSMRRLRSRCFTRPRWARSGAASAGAPSAGWRDRLPVTGSRRSRGRPSAGRGGGCGAAAGGWAAVICATRREANTRGAPLGALAAAASALSGTSALCPSVCSALGTPAGAAARRSTGRGSTLAWALLGAAAGDCSTRSSSAEVPRPRPRPRPGEAAVPGAGVAPGASLGPPGVLPSPPDASATRQRTLPGAAHWRNDRDVTSARRMAPRRRVSRGGCSCFTSLTHAFITGSAAHPSWPSGRR